MMNQIHYTWLLAPSQLKAQKLAFDLAEEFALQGVRDPAPG